MAKMKQQSLKFQNAMEKAYKDFSDNSQTSAVKRIPEGRANTPQQKRQVIEKVLAVWLAMPELRLGQLLCNSALKSGQDDLFYLEDNELCELVLDFQKKYVK